MSITQRVEILPPCFGYLGSIMVKPISMRSHPSKLFQQKLSFFIHPRAVEKSQHSLPPKIHNISLHTNVFLSNLDKVFKILHPSSQTCNYFIDPTTLPRGQFRQSSDELNYFKGAWISAKDVKIFSIFDLAHTLYFTFSRLTTLF